MAEELVSVVEPDRAGAQEPFHAGDQIGVGRLGDQMEMIAHQAPGVHLEGGLLASLGQRLDKVLPVHAAPKNILLAVPTAHDVVNGARVLHSQFACHKAKTTTFPRLRAT